MPAKTWNKMTELKELDARSNRFHLSCLRRCPNPGVTATQPPTATESCRNCRVCRDTNVTYCRPPATVTEKTEAEFGCRSGGFAAV
jgi:hypothetical protein